MKTLYIQKVKKNDRALSIDECLLFEMLSRVKGTSGWALAIQQTINEKSNTAFRKLIKDLYTQINDGKGCRKTMIAVIGERAVNKIIALVKPYQI